MTEVNQQQLIDLLPQLRDILEMPADYDLPKLYSIECVARQGQLGWQVKAQLADRQSNETVLDALAVWSVMSGAPVEICPEYRHWTGRRKARVVVQVAQVVLEVWAELVGYEAEPRMAGVAS